MSSPSADLRQALALHDQGDLVRAQALCEAIIARQPTSFEALHLLGLAAVQSGAPARALEFFGRAIGSNPRHPAAYAAFNNAGLALQDLQRPAEALRSFDESLARRPDYVPAWINRGSVLRSLERPAEALACYDRALALDDRCDAAHFNRGLLFLSQERMPEALAAFERALRLRPADVRARLGRGVAHRGLQRPAAARADFDACLALAPSYAEAHAERGALRRDLNDSAGALADLDAALALRPDMVAAHVNRGLVLRDVGDLQGAVAAYRRALQLDPGDAQAHLHLAALLLLTGDFAQGWQEYEWRWRSPRSWNVRNARDWQHPRWDGQEPLAGKTLLLHAEQGLGDTLQFCRFAALVAARTARVILEVPAKLAPLLGDLPGVKSLVTRPDPLPAFDLHCPLMSLPLALGIVDPAGFPAPVRYLSTDAARRESWRARLSTVQLRIGLAWFGSAENLDDARRSLPLADLARVLPVGPQYVSLQHERREADRAALAGRPDIELFGLDLDLADAAALCDSLDLVVSVDTAFAHLGAALGRPTWLLLSAVPDWRWQCTGDTSCWYPTMRLLRQPRPGQWAPVLERLAAGITDLMQR